MRVNLALGPLSMIKSHKILHLYKTHKIRKLSNPIKCYKILQNPINSHNYLLTIPGMYPQNQDLGRQVTSAGKQMTLAGAPETRVDQKATKNGDWPWLIMVLPWTNMGFTMNNCVFFTMK